MSTAIFSAPCGLSALITTPAARPSVAASSIIKVVPATLEHARAIRLRDGDALEVAALGVARDEAFAASLARSIWAETYLVDGEPAAILGLILPSLLGRVASPWLMTGQPVERHRKSFLRITRRRVEQMRGEWDLLVSWVHADYPRAIRWLRWLGFEISAARPFGLRGDLFHQATLKGLP
jgi:hypothetical protein